MMGRRTKPKRKSAKLAPKTLKRVDPIQVLREIAGNRRQPATARVAAAKALIALERPADAGALVPLDADSVPVAANDAATSRALVLLQRGRPH